MMTKRIMLIGCSKTKLPYQRDAKRGGRVLPAELYGGDLFRKRVDYANRQGIQWAVLSAAFGLWPSHVERNPTTKSGESLEVYDLTLSEMSSSERAAWHVSVASQIVDELWEPYHLGQQAEPMRPTDLHVEIHSGKDYAQPLATILEHLGIQTSLPCEGMGIGQQLAIYTSGILSAA